MSFFSNFLPDKIEFDGTWERALVEASFPGICSNNEGGLMTVHYDKKETIFSSIAKSDRYCQNRTTPQGLETLILDQY